MTECIQERFSFASHFSRRVEAGFTAGQVSSDGGAFLLRQVDRKINLLGRLAGCFRDGRSPLLVTHRLSEMLAQRIYGLALGYEDLNDHEQLRSDPLLGLLSGKRELEEPLAGKSTLTGWSWWAAQGAITRSATRPSPSTGFWSISTSNLIACRQLKSCSIWMRPTSRCTAISRSGSSTAITTATVICRCTSSPQISAQSYLSE